MKKLPGFALCVCLIFLVGCGSLPGIPETAEIGGVTYRTGFYGDLWPKNLKFSGDAVEYDGNEFNHVINDQFDWIHCDIGMNDCGVLYCAEDQWEQARAFYADGANFTYYCHIAKEKIADAKLATAPDMDMEMFNALFAFAAADHSSIFSSIKAEFIPMPDQTKEPSLIFYSESNDGLFTSFKGYTFYLRDGQLWRAIRYYRGDRQELLAAPVPEDLNEYFVALLHDMPEYIAYINT